jgi:hypothetical protein
MTSPGCSAATLSDVKAAEREQDFAEITNPEREAPEARLRAVVFISTLMPHRLRFATAPSAKQQLNGEGKACGSERRKGRLR